MRKLSTPPLISYVATVRAPWLSCPPSHAAAHTKGLNMSFWKKLLGGQDDSSPMVVECPHCKQPVTADKKLAGVTVSCPNSACARQFLIPAELFEKAPPIPRNAKGSLTCG